MKKFWSHSLSGVGAGVGVPEAVGVVAVVVVVVAGDIPGTDAVANGLAPGAAGEVARAGDVPGAAGVVAGTAGEVTGAVTGAVAAGFTGAVAGLAAVVGGAAGLAGDVWPNEVSARVTVQRLAISSVFIGLISELSRPRIPMSWVSS
jgi:hypothetical protein